MPPLPNVPKTLKYVVSWAIDGDTMGQTVHYFNYTGAAPTAANLSSAANGFVSDGSTDFAALCNTHVGMQNCTITDLTSPTSPQATAGTPWVGTRTGGQLSPGTAVLVAHSISRRYRGGKPRTYLPFGTSTDITTAGLWATALQTATDSAWGAWIASQVGRLNAFTAGAALCNVSYYHGFTVVTNPMTGRSRNVPTVRAVPIVDEVTGHTTSIVIASQRRRNRDA